MPNQDPSFTAVTWSDWLDRITKFNQNQTSLSSSVKKIYIWEEVWQSKQDQFPIQNKTSNTRTRQAMSRAELSRSIEGEELNKICDIPLEYISMSFKSEFFRQEKDKSIISDFSLDFASDFLNKTDIQSKITPIEKLLPEYGHRVI